MLTQQRCLVMTAFWIGRQDVERLGWVDSGHLSTVSRGWSLVAQEGSGSAIGAQAEVLFDRAHALDQVIDFLGVA
jgi:hypothetical protein